MKREPNPYSKNPRLTVTSTMSISVPSMVAEDVLNGTDAPVITVDPNVNDRIDTISGAVELMDTRIDAVSNMSELLYGSCVSADELLNDRIYTISGAVELMDTRIDGVSNMLALNGSGSSSGSSDVVLGEDLKKISFNITNNGVLYPSVQGTYESRLNYCSGISCCYFRDPSGGEWIHHAEMRFQKNTSTSDVEIQLRRDDSHDWITVASTADASSSESGGDISFSTRGGTDYRLGFKADSFSDDYSAIVSLKSTGSNEFSGIAALGTWLSAPSYQIGSVGTCMAVSGMGTLVFKRMDDTAIYDLNNLGGGSGPSEGIAAQSAVKFLTVNGDYSTVQGITLQPYYDYGMSNYDSAIIDLKLDTVSGQEFSGIVALRAGMAAPNKSDCDGNVTMEVSGMGVLLFQTHGHYESYDLNNLGGGSGSAAGVYELDLWDNGSDSGSQMLPLVKASNIEAARDVSVLNWTVGTSTSDAADASGMYTLIGNPIALYDSAYRGSNNSRIKGAVRVVDMHGTICWQRYSYTNKQWEIEPTEEILPDGVTMELLPYNPSYEQRKGRLARFTSSDGPLMATAPGIGLYTGNQSIVACLTAKSYDSSINKTTWKDYYTEYAESTDNGHSFMDITELIGRRQQLCDIASHLSQIRWLCENTAALYALVNK